MPKIIVVGDTHFQHEEPFFSMQKRFIKWFTEQEFNKDENIFISLGDLFDRYNPSPDVNFMVLDWFQNKMNFNKKIVISGNYKHEFDIRKRTWAIDVLNSLQDVELIKWTEERKIGKLDCLFLPWYYRTQHKDQIDMKELYESLPEKEYDFIFGHITDKDLFGEIVDIPQLKGKRIFGHVHSKDFGIAFLGTPYILSKNEKGEDKQIASIDMETGEVEYIQVPKFIDYYEVSYPDEPVIPDDCEYPVFEVFNAPSIEIAKEKYKDIIIKKNGIHKAVSDKDAESGGLNSGNRLSIKEYFENYCKEKAINIEVKKLIGGVL